MKTRGLRNAIGRLNGARKFGSCTLLAQAEKEAEHTLTQARAWLIRTTPPLESNNDDNYTSIELAVQELEQALGVSVSK